MIAESAPHRHFHGWKILALATFAQFVSVGFTLYLIGLYMEPLAKTFSATPGQLGWASSIFLVSAASLGPLLGYWVDKGKVRLLMTGGAIALALGFVLLSQAASLLQAALACALLIAPGSALLGVVTAGAMLVQWFERRRGLAIGIAAAGISAGGFAMPMVAAWLFSHYDWRTCSIMLGVFIAAALVPACWFIAVAKPSDRGQFADGAEIPPRSVGASAQVRRQGFLDLLARQDFWLITLAMGAINFTSITMIVYLVPYSREQGIDMQLSAMMLSVYSGSAFFGKFFVGWLCDRFQPQRILTGISLAMALGLLPMLVLDGLVFFPISAGIVGFSLGGLMPVWASLIALNFGPQAFGRVKGTMSLVLTSVAVIPGPLGGYLYDANGSYAVAFEVLVAVLLVGMVVSLFIPKPAVAIDEGVAATR